MGPSAMRIGGLHAKLARLDIKVEDNGDVRVKIPEKAPRGEKQQMFLSEITETCKTVADSVSQALTAVRLPVIFGG